MSGDISASADIYECIVLVGVGASTILSEVYVFSLDLIIFQIQYGADGFDCDYFQVVFTILIF